MKRNVCDTDVHRLQSGMALVDLPLQLTSTPTCCHPLACYLYRNPDGSLRWLWPQSASQPDFLRFYHQGGRRAQLFAWLVRLLFRLGLSRWVAQGSLTLYTTAEAATTLQQRTRHTNWALFTGTAGPNRKLVIWYSTATGEGYFAKLALAAPALLNLHREAIALRHRQQQSLLQIATPRLAAYSKGVLVQTDLGNDSQPIHTLHDLPSGTLSQLVRHNWHSIPLHQATCWVNAQATLHHLQATNDPRIPASLLHKLGRLMNSLDTRLPVALATAHGDFTPWNLFRKADQLVVIDWELHQPDLPGLYDLFHFLYQSTILFGNRGFRATRKAIDALLAQPEWRLFREQHQLDIERAEILYLIHTITYYLSVYSQQATWHKQVDWLLTTWNDALTYWLNRMAAMTDRQLLLHDLAVCLHNQPHAALKLTTYLDTLPDTSDLDLCLPESVARQLTRYLRQHPLAAQVIVDHRSFMQQLHIRCLDHTSLHVDLIWQFKRRQLEFMSAPPVWQQAVPSQYGLNVPAPGVNETYIRLFYGLNKATIPTHYQRQIGNSDNSPSPAELERRVRWQPANRGWRGLRNTFFYWLDTLRSFTFRPGLIVTFSGVDGAGKSTVIEQTKYQLEKRMRQRVVVLRHRPSLLPILSAWQYGKKGAEQRAAQTLPRQGTNQSRFSSVLRFSYYFVDYLLGQFYVQVRYVWLGYIVLYDRYYFDFINDSRRSNLYLPAGLAGSLYRLLLKPRLNVFLYAPSDEILRRKQELDAATITDLTRRYLSLFDRLQRQYPGSDYMPVLNQDLSLTLSRIFTRIQAYTA